MVRAYAAARAARFEHGEAGESPAGGATHLTRAQARALLADLAHFAAETETE